MRVLITGIPGDSKYFSDFEARTAFLARVVKEQGHKVRNTVTSSRRKLLGVFKWIADDKFDAVIFEHSMEKRPDILIGVISGLAKDTPVLFLRPDLFDDGVIYSEGNSKRRMLIKDFVELLQKEGYNIGFEYYCYSKIEISEYDDPANSEIKQVIRNFLIGAGPKEREQPVLSGREREV